MFLGADVRNSSVPTIQVFRQELVPSLLPGEGDAKVACVQSSRQDFRRGNWSPTGVAEARP